MPPALRQQHRTDSKRTAHSQHTPRRHSLASSQIRLPLKIPRYLAPCPAEKEVRTHQQPAFPRTIHRVAAVPPLQGYRKLLNHPTDGLLVKLELAILCDVGAVIRRATYALESDTPMIEKVVMICDRSSRGLYAAVAALGSL